MKYDSDLIETIYALQQNNPALAERMWNRLVKQEQDSGDVHVGYGKIVPESLVKYIKQCNVTSSTYHKIQAIKEVRNRTGWGLKEAKDAVEFMIERGIVR